MKCINKAVILALISALLFTGCAKFDTTVSYDIYESSYQYNLAHRADTGEHRFFSTDICVSDTADVNADQADYILSEGSGVFNVSKGSVLYQHNAYTKLYPASTTKVLTALCALKYGDLDKTVTVSELACDIPSDAASAKLRPGDQITIRQLMYGLLLPSGNDAAIAIAEGVSGDYDTFIALMNQEARALGATNSHFVNPNGLHDDDHYTTIYDMYLIFKEVIKYEELVNIMNTASFEAYYTDASGNAVSRTYETTNGYLKQNVKAPAENMTVIGGKTGTTFDAGYCLVLYSRNSRNEEIISIVFKADGRTNLYYLMTELLNIFGEA